MERFGIIFHEKTSINKTELYLITRLGWYSFNEYLDWFISKDFIRHKKMEGVDMYYMTESGRNVFTILATLLGVIK
jgi:predicted transcriptional regulator